MAELLDTMSSSELTEWIAYSEKEPFGGLVDDLRAGLAPAMTVNANLGKDGKPMQPLDFFPWRSPHLFVKPETKPETPEELAARIKREVFGVSSNEVQ